MRCILVYCIQTLFVSSCCKVKVMSVMKKESYSLVLKELLNFSQIKYAALSHAIGYDLSYVSKWTTGIRLPAAKNVDRINQEIARFLSEIIIKQNNLEAFAEHFLGRESIEQENVAFEIYQSLSCAYRSSLECKKGVSISNITDDKIVLGKAECFAFLQKIIKETLEESTVPPTIIITGEFFNLAKNHFWQIFYDIKLNHWPCDIHVFLDLSELEKGAIGAAEILFQCLNDLLNYDFTIYEKKSNAYNNIIAINNEFVIFYSVNAAGEIEICTSSADLKQAHSVYTKCKQFMASQPVILEPKQTLGMTRFGFRDQFYASQKFFFFCVNGFEFLLPDEVFNSMIEKAKVGNLGMADVEWVQRVQNLFKNLLEKVPLRFMLPTNSIVRYLETGNINLTDFPYQMTIEERKLHIKHVLQLIQSNPNITFGVLLPTTEKYSGTNFINLSFNTSYSTGFLKKNIQLIHPDTLPIYFIKNTMLLNSFQAYFDNLTKSKHYKEYTAKELEELYKKYYFLIEFLFKE